MRRDFSTAAMVEGFDGLYRQMVGQGYQEVIV